MSQSLTQWNEFEQTLGDSEGQTAKPRVLQSMGLQSQTMQQINATRIYLQ